MTNKGVYMTTIQERLRSQRNKAGLAVFGEHPERGIAHLHPRTRKAVLERAKGIEGSPFGAGMRMITIGRGKKKRFFLDI